MTVPDYLYTAGSIIVSLGGGAALVLAMSGWLGKVWAARFLAKEKAELERLGFEHQTRFTRLHEKQMIFIASLYKKLRQLDYGVKQVHFWIHQNPPNKEWVAKASLALTDKYVTAREYFEQHQIYFNEDICEKLRQVMELSSDVSDEFFVSLIDKDTERLAAAVLLARSIVDKKAKVIEDGLHIIENTFRKHLGVVK